MSLCCWDEPPPTVRLSIAAGSDAMLAWKLSILAVYGVLRTDPVLIALFDPTATAENVVVDAQASSC